MKRSIGIVYVRKIVLAALITALPPVTGCSTIAMMAAKHVVTKAGINVAKDAYHKLKGDSEDASGQAVPVMQSEIQVTSTPPGARIEVNRKYVGDAPVRVRVEVDAHGCVKRDWTIKAIPAQKGQHPQKYRLLHYTGEPSDRPPANIAFDLSTPSQK